MGIDRGGAKETTNGVSLPKPHHSPLTTHLSAVTSRPLSQQQSQVIMSKNRLHLTRTDWCIFNVAGQVTKVQATITSIKSQRACALQAPMNSRRSLASGFYSSACISKQLLPAVCSTSWSLTSSLSTRHSRDLFGPSPDKTKIIRQSGRIVVGDLAPMAWSRRDQRPLVL